MRQRLSDSSDLIPHFPSRAEALLRHTLPPRTTRIFVSRSGQLVAWNRTTCRQLVATRPSLKASADGTIPSGFAEADDRLEKAPSRGRADKRIRRRSPVLAATRVLSARNPAADR